MAKKNFKTIFSRNVNPWYIFFRGLFYMIAGALALSLPLTAPILLLAPLLVWGEVLLKSCFDYFTRNNIPENTLKEVDAEIENFTNLAEWHLKMAVIAEYKPRSTSSTKLVQEIKKTISRPATSFDEMKQQKKALRTYIEASHNAGKGLLWRITENFKPENASSQEVATPSPQKG